MGAVTTQTNSMCVYTQVQLLSQVSDAMGKAQGTEGSVQRARASRREMSLQKLIFVSFDITLNKPAAPEETEVSC